MLGQMMTTQLTITSIMEHARKLHGEQEIVSITADNPLHRYRFRDCFARVAQLANALMRLGAGYGDRIGTLAWNDYRHLEVYFATSCSGTICHTINPRLFPEQIEYIINHAEDRVLFIDPAFVPLLEQMQDRLEYVEAIVVLGPEQAIRDTTLRNAIAYESLIAPESAFFEWPALDENAASALCYTSGTTGNPKGVLYSHRSVVLHTYGVIMPDSMGLSGRDVVMPIVPMFHVNAWSIPYAAAVVGAKLVLVGAKAGDAETLVRLIDSESVTISGAVPTVWLALLAYLNKTGKTLTSLQRVAVGGSACPRAVMEELESKHGVYVFHAWGLTETSPIASFNGRLPDADGPTTEEQWKLRSKVGRQVFGIELKIVDADGKELPWDGEAFGALKVRGPWVCSGYYGLDSSPAHAEPGWFETGDVATIDARGYVAITDRTKDVIKSGGEWISSIDLENTAVAHPLVAEAAVIGAPHPRWAERPLLCVVPVAGAKLDREDMLGWFEGKVAKWWIPDDVLFLSELPHTATGKISKKDLRERLKDYRFPHA
jgi:3-(methylthio)propionyl---CoA ligase